MPLAIVRDGEGLMPAFGQDGFGVGGPVEFAFAAGLALQAKGEGVRPGGLDADVVESEAGIVAGAGEDELFLLDRELCALRARGSSARRAVPAFAALRLALPLALPARRRNQSTLD